MSANDAYERLEDKDRFWKPLETLCHAIDGTSTFKCEVSKTDPQLLLVDGKFTGLCDGHYLSIQCSQNTFDFFAEKFPEAGDVPQQVFGNAPIASPSSLGKIDIHDWEGVRTLLATLGILLPENWYDN